jgi:hypothetical protein
MLQRFTLNRAGIVRLAKPSNNQCKVKGHGDYEYFVRITTSTRLDRDKFIIDHAHIHIRIAAIFAKKSTSCEELCLLVEEGLRTLLLGHGVGLVKLHIRLKPLSVEEETKAYMELETEY